MTRALIRDPELPAKTEAGRLDDIRACISCNQACIGGHFHAGYPISCIQFPESGREREFRASDGRSEGSGRGAPRRESGDDRGGQAFKAAAVAAERGHRVTLVEAGRRVGGQVLLAQEAAGAGRDRRGGDEPAVRGPAVGRRDRHRRRADAA
jgi:hypothetical protein